MLVTSYSEARNKLASLLDKVADDRERVLIQRRGRPDAVLIDAHELAGLEETAHLLRSPANAARLLETLEDVRAGRNLVPMSVEELRREVGLDG